VHSNADDNDIHAVLMQIPLAMLANDSSAGFTDLIGRELLVWPYQPPDHILCLCLWLLEHVVAKHVCATLAVHPGKLWCRSIHNLMQMIDACWAHEHIARILLIAMFYAMSILSETGSMQAIESKKAAGDTASVQQEVDGIVQQLRLHVGSLSYTSLLHTSACHHTSQSLPSGRSFAHILHLVTTAPWELTTAQLVAIP